MATMTLQMGQIVSVSDVQKRFKEVRETTQKTGKSVIFNNNKPDMVLMTIEQYEAIQEALEYCEVQSALERSKKGTFISSEEFKKRTGLNF